VVPKFQEIFRDLGEDLPAPTKMLLGLSAWVHGSGWVYLLGAPPVFFLLIRVLKISTGGRYFLDSVAIRLPVLGMIVSKTAIARFSRTLGTLLGAGVPILEALLITADTAGNEVYSRALHKVRDGIREGESVAGPLRTAKIVDPMVVNMIDVGEETGELDKMLAKIADTYDEEVETLVTGLTSLLEPVMVITLGVIVGFIVVSLFMPMVGMIQAMQK
jgi:type IV pilus assembly protein PilC